MPRLVLLLVFAILALWVISLISCLSAEEGEVRALPRWAWLLIILLTPPAGSILYLLAGRPVPAQPRPGIWRPGGWFPEYEPPRQLAPDDDPEFLRRLSEQTRKDNENLLRRREEDLRRRERELRDKDDSSHPDA